MRTLVNKVQLIGNLGEDPIVKELDNDKVVAKFSMATNESYKSKDGEKVTDTQWHKVVAWGKIARIVEQYLHKGDKVAIEGRLSHRSYDGDNGIKRWVTEVVVTDLLMLSSKHAEKPAEEDVPF